MAYVTLQQLALLSTLIYVTYRTIQITGMLVLLSGYKAQRFSRKKTVLLGIAGYALLLGLFIASFTAGAGKAHLPDNWFLSFFAFFMGAAMIEWLGELVFGKLNGDRISSGFTTSEAAWKISLGLYLAPIVLLLLGIQAWPLLLLGCIAVYAAKRLALKAIVNRLTQGFPGPNS